jgi:hypothetical protein
MRFTRDPALQGRFQHVAIPRKERNSPRSQSHIERVREYIRSQQKHHASEDFKTEFRRFCKKNGVPVDERYVWD